MKKIIAILLCAGMVFSFSACKDADTNTNNPGSDLTQEELSAPVENPEDVTSQDQNEVNEYGMPMTTDSMLDVLEALIVTDVLTDYEYAMWDTSFVWTACNILVASGNVDTLNVEFSGDRMYVANEEVRECLNAMFAGFDGNTDELPEIPENVDVLYDESNDRYGFSVGDYGAQSLRVLQWEESGSNGISMKVALFSEPEGEQFTGVYDVFMNLTTYETDAPMFSYMITSFVMTEAAPNNVEIGEDAISEQDALKIVESAYGKDGEADSETGNVVGYGYEGIATIDGVNYHNFRMTWLVMNEQGEADHSSYLQNVFVSMDGNEVLEGFRGADGWEIVED